MKKIFEKLKNKKKYIFFIFISVIFLIFFWLSSKISSSEFRCPKDFDSQEEYLYSVAGWAKAYLKEHPGVSQEEIIKARNEMLEKFDCGKSPFDFSVIN